MQIADARCCHCQKSSREVVLVVWQNLPNCMVCLKVHHPRAWSQLIKYVQPFIALGDT